MSRQVYTAKELGEVLGCSESLAYKYIRQMNAELTKQGFLTVRVKFPRHTPKSGSLAGLRKPQRAHSMPSREELLQSIQQGMKLDKAFFLKVYGYEITWPGFAETAIKALEDAGCSKARSYYEQITTEYEDKYHEGLKEAAEWYSKQLAQKWEREERKGEELRKQEEINLLMQKRELLQRLNK